MAIVNAFSQLFLYMHLHTHTHALTHLITQQNFNEFLLFANTFFFRFYAILTFGFFSCLNFYFWTAFVCSRLVNGIFARVTKNKSAPTNSTDGHCGRKKNVFIIFFALPSVLNTHTADPHNVRRADDKFSEQKTIKAKNRFSSRFSDKYVYHVTLWGCSLVLKNVLFIDFIEGKHSFFYFEMN